MVAVPVVRTSWFGPGRQGVPEPGRGQHPAVPVEDVAPDGVLGGRVLQLRPAPAPGAAAPRATCQ